MIFVEEKTNDRQFKLLFYLASLGEYKLCLWLYPESKIKSIAGYELTQFELEQVTVYDDGIVPYRTVSVDASEKNLKSLLLAKSEIKSECDSVALYPNNSNEWLACTIGHEGMCLVRNIELLTPLLQAGFAATTEAPSWW